MRIVKATTPQHDDRRIADHRAEILPHSRQFRSREPRRRSAPGYCAVLIGPGLRAAIFIAFTNAPTNTARPPKSISGTAALGPSRRRLPITRRSAVPVTAPRETTPTSGPRVPSGLLRKTGLPAEPTDPRQL